jgi:hypothetical protein
MDEVNNKATDNRKVRIKLQPVLPVSVEFYCECSNPPMLLPPPHTIVNGEQFTHQCPRCGEHYILSHASGAIMYQKIEKADDAPKFTITNRLPS